MLNDFLKKHKPTDEEAKEAQKYIDILKHSFKNFAPNFENRVWLKVINESNGFHYYIISQVESHQYTVIDYNEAYKTKYNDYLFSEGILACLIDEMIRCDIVKPDNDWFFDNFNGYTVNVRTNRLYSKYYLRKVTDDVYLGDSYYRIKCQNDLCNHSFYYLDSNIIGGRVACPKCGWFNY